jgi:hypothetical protein
VLLMATWKPVALGFGRMSTTNWKVLPLGLSGAPV